MGISGWSIEIKPGQRWRYRATNAHPGGIDRVVSVDLSQGTHGVVIVREEEEPHAQLEWSLPAFREAYTPVDIVEGCSPSGGHHDGCQCTGTPGPDIERGASVDEWAEHARNVLTGRGVIEIKPHEDGWRVVIVTGSGDAVTSRVSLASALTMALDRVKAGRIARAKETIRQLAHEELARVRREHDLPDE